MIEALLGPVIDIHGGGVDLVFPHHENEMAQSAVRCRPCRLCFAAADVPPAAACRPPAAAARSTASRSRCPRLRVTGCTTAS